MNNIVYRLTIWSHFEEDEDSEQPFFFDYSSYYDAIAAKELYMSEIMLSGQHAYTVCGPTVIKI